MEIERWKEVGGCSVKKVVVVQVEREVMGTNPVLVLVVGDEGSLERDVAAENEWARAHDRDSLRFPR
jgi:hypothetical protein